MENLLIYDSLIREGNLYFNRQEYEKSAETYERVGQWAITHSLSNQAISEAFKLAINAWISSCKIENVFRILEKETFDGKFEILRDSYKQIEAMVKYLILNNKMEQPSGDELLMKVKQKLNELKPEAPVEVQEGGSQLFKKPFSAKELLKELREDLR